VAVVYLVAAVAVAAIVTGNLTAQIDDRLHGAVENFTRQAPRPELPGPPPGDRPFGPTLLVWAVRQDGTVVSGTSGVELPAAAATLDGLATMSVGGASVRLLGVAVENGRIVVGQTLDPVDQARGNIVTAEVAIGLVLIAVIFLGAVAVGWRVAAPIEQARQRQLEFTADASHELRTPLAVIEAQTSLALAQPRDAEWYRRGFERISTEARRMRRLVDDLLWLARFDATTHGPAPEPVDLGILAGLAVDRFAALAETRRLHLALEAGGGSHVVRAPAEWLDRLLGVLLDNACKYAPEAGSVRVVVNDEGGRVRLAVDDSGPGIPPEERERIFDRFRRATSSAGGAGLGLAIADAIVRATGGRWRVGTSPQGGASLAVTWPRALAEAAAAGAGS
jgi:signal transduction histidine kinase